MASGREPDRWQAVSASKQERKAWGDGLTEKAVWHVVREYARKAGIERLAPHDLRRTCARLCHASGGELEQIQFLLGHVSIQTTERYLGCKQRIRSAVNDGIGIEPKRESSQPAQRHNAPALFAVLVLPYGFTGAGDCAPDAVSVAKEWDGGGSDRHHRRDSMLPSVWSFLWSPLADAGFRRRSWVLVSALSAGLAAASAILNIHGSHLVLTVLLFLMNAFGGLLSSTCGALLTAMPVSLRGRSAGWYQGGNMGGGAIGGGLFLWLGDHASLPVVAMLIAAAMVLPALAALFIEETAPVRQAIGPQFAGLAHDLGEVFRARRTWLGLIFFLSPGAAGSGVS